MSEEPLAVGGSFVIVGFILSVAHPYISPSIKANIGLWGVFFILIGLLIIVIRLRSMTTR